MWTQPTVAINCHSLWALMKIRGLHGTFKFPKLHVTVQSFRPRVALNTFGASRAVS